MNKDHNTSYHSYSGLTRLSDSSKRNEAYSDDRINLTKLILCKMKTADTCRNSIFSQITVLNFLTTDTKINCIFQRSLNYNKFGLLKRCQFGNIDLVMGWNLKTIIHFSPFSVNLTCPTWNMSNKFPSYPYSWFLWHDIIFYVYSSCIFPLICLLHDWWHKICHSQT